MGVEKLITAMICLVVFMVLRLLVLTLLIGDNTNIDTPKKNIKRKVFTEREKAVHESSHCIIYKSIMNEMGFKDNSVSVSIIEDTNRGGGFLFSGDLDFNTFAIVFYSGYASRVVFFNERPEDVFNEMRSNNYSDYLLVKERRGSRKVTEYQDFIDTVKWVEKYKDEIDKFAIRLEKEKFIEF